ncbi:SANT/Myb-like DNA-binding domain-containing protein [bacterium]|nr:SANT/Myb-like DNA-binding domain-containing protein [bacterium]
MSSSVDWTEEEISLFLEGLDDYGPKSNDQVHHHHSVIPRSQRWKMIAAHVGTRTEEETREYAKKFLAEMKDSSSKSNSSSSSSSSSSRRRSSRKSSTAGSSSMRRKGRFAMSDSLSKVPDVVDESLEVKKDTWSYDEVLSISYLYFLIFTHSLTHSLTHSKKQCT